mgnify:CR=1 FL=1
MRFLIWLLRVVIFIALFGLAIKNSGLVELRFYFSNFWQAPLSLVILGCFAGGIILGLTAGFATMIRQRREIARLEGCLRARAVSDRPVSRLPVATAADVSSSPEFPLT